MAQGTDFHPFRFPQATLEYISFFGEYINKMCIFHKGKDSRNGVLYDMSSHNVEF